MQQLKTRFRKYILLILCLAVSVLANSASAQVTTSSILGVVTDPTGGAIPNAEVSVRDVDRNLTKTVTTNGSGEYRVDFLLTGNYTVSVSMTGFKTYVQNGITLNAGVPVTINSQLSAGAVSETIEVTSNAPLVETSNPELGTTVDRKQITELPLVNRNPYTLLDLTPGVQSNVNVVDFGAPTQQTIINGGSFNAAGSTNYYLDGAPNLNALNSTGGILPNPDALQEFRVQTNSYGAAFGRFPSGIVNALVRSGTNTLHGTVFEFFRNPHLNARPWRSLPTAPKEPLHRNQFGATLGGPILKGNTFFFGSYAGLRQTDATLYQGAVVPTALERSGNFTQSLGTRPKDPVTGTNFVCNGVVDVICPNRIDPVALKLLNYVPAANTTITTANGAAPAWTGYAPNPLNQDDFLLKVNRVLSAAHSLSVTYFMSAGNISANASGTGLGGIIAPYSSFVQTWRQQNSVVNDTWTATPTIVNNIWLSYTRMRNARFGSPSTSLADLGSSIDIQGKPALPDITVNGFWHMANNNAGPTYSDNYAVRDLVTWNRGNHTLQFGGEFLLDKGTKAAQLNNYGIITFSGVVTKNAYSDFLLGTPSSFVQDSPAYTRTSAFTYAGFIQDDYRVSHRLTLNLGFRYDVQTPPVEANNHNTTYVPGQQSTRFPNAPRGVVFPGDAGVPRGLTPVRYGHVSPRVGFAWDPLGDAKTSIRGGAGLFWGSVTEELWTQAGNGSPFALSYTAPNTSSYTGATLSNPYKGLSDPFPGVGTFPFGTRISAIDSKADWPRTVQTNLSLQRQFSDDVGITIAYVGAFSSNLGSSIDNNYPSLNTNYAASLNIAQCGTSATITPTVSNAQCRRSLQPIGALAVVQTNFNASYNALQVQVTKRMSHQLSASGYYSWSKTMNDLSLQNRNPGAGIQDVNNLSAERGRASLDLTHQAVISLIWQPQVGFTNRIAKSVINGWSFVPFVRLHSGAPFTVLNGVDANLDGAGGDRAQLIGNPYTGAHTTARWFNVAAFAQNPAVAGSPVDGNSSVNIINSPAFHNLDLTIARTFPIHGDINLQVRAEGSNAFNIVNLSAPGNTVNTATFGAITAASAMRQVQLGAKVNF